MIWIIQCANWLMKPIALPHLSASHFKFGLFWFTVICWLVHCTVWRRRWHCTFDFSSVDSHDPILIHRGPIKHTLHSQYQLLLTYQDEPSHLWKLPAVNRMKWQRQHCSTVYPLFLSTAKMQSRGLTHSLYFASLTLGCLLVWILYAYRMYHLLLCSAPQA